MRSGSGTLAGLPTPSGTGLQTSKSLARVGCPSSTSYPRFHIPTWAVDRMGVVGRMTNQIPGMGTKQATSLDRGRGHPDPLALAVARELQHQLPETQEVVLFGSRARGNWHLWSDLDLAVIGDSSDKQEQNALRQQAKRIVEDLYHKALYVQVVPIPRTEFEALRTSLPHLVGQVQRWGIKPNGERLPHMTQNNPWPGVQTRLQSVRRHLVKALKALAVEDSDSAIQNAQGVLETTLKAAHGALGGDPENTHDLQELIDTFPEAYRDWLDGMLSKEQMEELTTFRVKSAYSGEDIPWPTDSAEYLVDAVQDQCGRLAGLILDFLGKTPHEVGYVEWVGEGPLAGWESVALDYFSPVEVELRRDTEDAIGLLHRHMSAILPAQGLNRIEAAWREKGAPPDAVDRMFQVQREPSQWQSLLPGDAAFDNDDTQASDNDTCPPPPGP